MTRDDGESAGAEACPAARAPDYRFSLANERTFLAYIRTSLALLAAGVAIEQLVPPFSIPGGRSALSILLLCLAIVVAGSSYRRWRQTEYALELQAPLPSSRLPLVLGAGLLLASIAALVLVILKAVR